MKYSFIIIIFIFLLFSCNQKTPKNVEVKSTTLEKTSNFIKQEKEVYNVNLEEEKYNLSMFNNKYLMRIIPDSSALRNNMMYRILLTIKSDTIVNQAINIDTIAVNFSKKDKNDEIIKFKKKYYLSDINFTSSLSRSSYVRFRANLNAKKDSTVVYVNLQLEYIGAERGKLSAF